MTDSSSQASLELSQMRKEFEAIILKRYNSKKNLFEWRTKEWIEKKIESIEKYKICYRYNIKETNGKKVLTIARGVRGLNLQIVPIEDYFEVIYTAHILTGHGRIERVKEYLENSQLYVPHNAVLRFMGSCVACNMLKNQNRIKNTSHHAFLELIDMSDTPDGNMKYVMHYRALKIRRMFLRSLSSSDAGEVAEKLPELFRDIGPPRVLHTPTKSFTKALILRLAIVYPDSKIICGRQMQFEAKTRQIKNGIINWMSCNNSTEWSERLYSVTGYKHRLIRPENKTNKIIDENLPGPSFRQQDTTLQKQAHESYLETTISAGEVLELLKPQIGYTTYSKKTEQPPPQPSTSETQNKVHKTYTKKNKKISSNLLIPLADKETERNVGTRALCVDTNIREVAVEPTKTMVKKHKLWNSALDLPKQPALKKKTVIGMNMTYNTNFGKITQESTEIFNKYLYNEVGQLCSPYDASTEQLETKSLKEEPCVEVLVECSPQDCTPLKDEMPPLTMTADHISDKKPAFEDPLHLNPLESIYIKEEPASFETLSNLDALKKEGVKEEVKDHLFGKIIKVESLDE